MKRRSKTIEQVEFPYSGSTSIHQVYGDHFNHYQVFKKTLDEAMPLIRPMEHKLTSCVGGRETFDDYVALRPSGDFFAYDRPVVWVRVVNNSTSRTERCRNFMRGFFITITTVDDTCLLLDWVNPLTEEALKQVLGYFDVLAIDGLESSKKVQEYIEGMIGAADYCDHS